MSLLSLIEQGGIALIPLGICSVLVLAVILERVWTFARVGAIPVDLMQRAEALLAAGAWQDAIRLLDASPSPFARVAKASLMHSDASEEEVADVLALACDSELSDATRPLPIIGTTGNIAPFIGLFGTVIGIMKAFQQVADKQAAGASVVSAGIAEALIATAAGLAVGICAVIANNWCNAWVERYRLRLERFSTEWSYTLKHLPQRESVPAEPVA